MLPLHRLPRALTHTKGLPLYATNPSLVDTREGGRLFLVRVTPLTIGCSALPVATVLAADYAENSWSVLARLDDALHASANWTILARIRNSQDARGLLLHHDKNEERSGLWVAHNTIPPHAAADARPGTSAEAPPSRMELLQYTWTSSSSWMRDSHHESTRQRYSSPRLRRRLQLSYAGSVAGVAEKNWVPLAITRDGGSDGASMLMSYSLQPHLVLRCAFNSGVCAHAYETSSPDVWAPALASLSGQVGRQCTGAHAVASKSTHGVVMTPTPTAAKSARSSAAAASTSRPSHAADACNASRGLPHTHPTPRGGTPCVPLLGTLVCLGHLKARLRGQYKSTYYHIFYSMEPHAPYTILNASFPFRFATLGKAALESTRAALGATFSRKLTSFLQEKIQFATGLIRAAGGAEVIVSWGVADCTGATRSVPVKTVSALLARTLRVQAL